MHRVQVNISSVSSSQLSVIADVADTVEVLRLYNTIYIASHVFGNAHENTPVQVKIQIASKWNLHVQGLRATVNEP